MLVNLIEIKTTEKEAIKKALNKIPLLSRVIQFNKGINDMSLKYIEYKILKYKVESRKNDFLKNSYRIVVLNTYTGAIKYTDEMPVTVKKYISRDCVQTSKINEYIFKSKLKAVLEKNCRKYQGEKMVLEGIFSIYKPFWIFKYNGRKILLDA